ncbi:MAG TPA: hypothetical protein VFY13_04170, partial [Luteolibacter sp.]|nr:hypothetical protein [Luteolibacter sp.]
MRRLALSAVLISLCHCGHQSQVPVAQPLLPGDPTAPSQVTPNEAIGIAQQLASHPWQPYGHNVLHGKDRHGVVVHTPDISHEPVSPRRGWWVAGMTNHGIPYKWGGYDSP